MNKKTDHESSLWGKLWDNVGGYVEGIIAIPLFLTILFITADEPVAFTWLLSSGLVVGIAFFWGRVRGSKDMRKWVDDDSLKTKTDVRYFEIDLDKKGKGFKSNKATVEDLIDYENKGDKDWLYGLITTFVIYIFLAWSGLWHNLLKWLSDLFGVYIY
tara:strand:+ start:436 stop:909 length:474 start_codon:yes stop_codon:yes gene_type:complete